MHPSEVRNCILSMFENHMFYWGPALKTQVSCETFCKKHKWFMLISRSALYCLAKYDHIYTMNHKTNSLSQINTHVEDEEGESEYQVVAFTDYYVKEDAELILSLIHI